MIDAMEAARARSAGYGYGFTRPLNLDEPTYIIGPGPNGRDFIAQLDPRVSAIALNKACEIKPWRYWLCIDANAYRCDWYHKVSPGSIAIMGEWAKDRRASYIMRLEDCPEATGVCGAALNICAAADIRSVVLVGVDMYANYYDGTPSSHPAEWAHRPHLDALIQALQARSNMRVYTASKTLLDVPEWS